jgi:hypothetical protein
MQDAEPAQRRDATEQMFAYEQAKDGEKASSMAMISDSR